MNLTSIWINNKKMNYVSTKLAMGIPGRFSRKVGTVVGSIWKGIKK